MSENRAPQVYEVAVVGAAGFLGAAVVNAFDHAGISSVSFTLEEPVISDGKVSPAAMGVSTIVWCASRINPRLVVDHPELVDADTADLARVLAAVREWEAPPRIVTFSSGGTVYGPPATPPFNEAQTPAPVNAYGQAKLAVEHQVRDSGLESVALRVANAYGPGQRPAPGQGVIAHWFEAVLADEPLQLFGHPDDTRDYVYVDDIARAAVAAHRAASPPPVVNIGSGRATTLDDLLAAVRLAVSPRDPQVIRHPARSTDTAHSTLDIALAREGLGWEPMVSLEEGVAAQWAWRLTQ